MPTSSEDGNLVRFWEALQMRLGNPVPKNVKTFVRLRNYDERWLSAGARERIRIEADVVALVRDLGASGLLDDEERLESSEEAVKLEGDERWPLLRELMAESGSPDWREIRLRRVVRTDSRGFPGVDHRVEIDLDARVSLKALKAELDRVWRFIRKEGWVNRTRPLDARNIALARFICLESEPGVTWQQRLDEWNKRYTFWTFKDKRDLESQVRRIERQLTGRNYGLAWFYDQDARDGTYEHMSRAELRALPPKRRDHARRLLDARLDAFLPVSEAFLLYRVARGRELMGEYARKHILPSLVADTLASLTPVGDGTVPEHVVADEESTEEWADEEVEEEEWADEEVEEEEWWRLPDEETELRDLGLEGRRLPRTDLGEWVLRTPYSELFDRASPQPPDETPASDADGERSR
jgi:hypothetical protein